MANFTKSVQFVCPATLVCMLASMKVYFSRKVAIDASTLSIGFTAR